MLFSGASAYHSQQIGKCDLVLSIFGTNDHNFIGPPVKISWIHNADTAITEKMSPIEQGDLVLIFAIVLLKYLD